MPLFRRLTPLATAITVALFLAGSVLASTAQAAPQFQATKYPVTVHGSGKANVLKLGTSSDSVVCQSAFHGQLSGASSTLRLAVSWTECKAFGFINATVNTEGCEYVMHATEEVVADEYKAHLSLECPTGKSIKFVIPIAEPAAAEYKSQTGMTTVRLNDDTAASPVEDITVDFEVTGVRHTVTKPGLWFSGTGEKTDGEISTSEGITMTGQSPSSPSEKIGIKVSDPVKEHEKATHEAATPHEKATELREDVEHEEHTLSTTYPEPPRFSAAKYPATIHGSSTKGNLELLVGTDWIRCSNSFHGEIGAASSTLDLATTFTGCDPFGASPTTVNTEGCGLRLHATSVVEKDKYDGRLGIKCPIAKSIKVTSGPCALEIKEQITSEVGPELVQLLNMTSASPVEDITFSPEAAGFSYIITKDESGCAFSGVGEKLGLLLGYPITLTGQNPSNASEKIGVRILDKEHEKATDLREDVEHEEHTLSTTYPEPPRFTAAKYPATIHGSSTKGALEFTVGGPAVRCSNSFHGEIGAASSTLDLATTFTGCDAISSNPTTVAMEGCSFRLHATSTIAKDQYNSRLGIKCPIAQSIKVTAGPCALEIKEQITSWPGVESVQLLNMTSASPVEDITFNPEATLFDYIITKDESGCSLSGVGEKLGVLFGYPITLTGQNPSNATEKIGVRVS